MSNLRTDPNPDDDVFGPPASSSRPETRTSTSRNPEHPEASSFDESAHRIADLESFPKESLSHVFPHFSLPRSVQRVENTRETTPPLANNPAVRQAEDLGAGPPDSPARSEASLPRVFDPPTPKIQQGKDTPDTTPSTSPDRALPPRHQTRIGREHSPLVSPESRRRNGAPPEEPTPSRSSRHPSARSTDIRRSDAMAEAAGPETPASAIPPTMAAQTVVAEQLGPIGEPRMNEEPAAPGEIEHPAAPVASESSMRNEGASSGNAGAPRPRVTPRPLPLPPRNTRWAQPQPSAQPQPRKIKSFKSTDPGASRALSEPTITEDRGLGNWEAVLPNTSFPLGRGPFDAIFPPKMQSFDNRNLMHDHLERSAEEMYSYTDDGIVIPVTLNPLLLEVEKGRPFISHTKICQLADEGTRLASSVKADLAKSIKADRLARASHRSQLGRQNLQVTSGRDIYMQNRASYAGDPTEVENAIPLFYSAYGPIAPEPLEVSGAHQLDGLRALILSIEKQHPQVPLPSVRELQKIAQNMPQVPLPKIEELQAIGRTTKPGHSAISSADNFNENDLSLILERWCNKNSIVLQLGVRSKARTTIYARTDGSVGETVWLHLQRDGVSDHSVTYHWSALPAPPARTTDPQEGLMRRIVRAIFDFIGLNIDKVQLAYLQSSTQRSLLFSLPRFGSGAGPKKPMKRALGWAYKLLKACGASLSDELNRLAEKLGVEHWGGYARDYCGGPRDTVLKSARDLYQNYVIPAGVQLNHAWQSFRDTSQELWHSTPPSLPWIALVLLMLFVFWWRDDWLIPILRETISDNLLHADEMARSAFYDVKHDMAMLRETLCQFFALVAAEIDDAFVTAKSYFIELKAFVMGWLRDVYMPTKPSAGASSLPTTASSSTQSLQVSSKTTGSSNRLFGRADLPTIVTSSSQSLQASSKTTGSSQWPLNRADLRERIEHLQMPQIPEMPEMPQMPELPITSTLIVFVIMGSLASAFLILVEHPHLIVYWISRIFEQTSQWFRNLRTSIVDIGGRAQASASHTLRDVQAGTAKQATLWFQLMSNFWTLVLAWVNYVWEERGNIRKRAAESYQCLVRQVRKFPLRRAALYILAWLLIVLTLSLGVWLALWRCGVCSGGSARGSYPCNMGFNSNNTTQFENVDDLRQQFSTTIEELNRRQDDLYSFASIAVQPITTTVTMLARATPVAGWGSW